MRIISQKALHGALFRHPYENTAYEAKMSVVGVSEDKRLLLGYWEAPVGEVEITYGENEEYNLVLEGSLEAELPDGSTVSAKQGDILVCGGQNEGMVLFRIKEPVRTIFIVYPQTQADAAHVEAMQHKENGAACR